MGGGGGGDRQTTRTTLTLQTITHPRSKQQHQRSSNIQGRNVVLESKYGSPKIVNDGVTIAREVELEDPVENIGAKLVRQAAARTNDTAGDGTTTATIMSAAFISEGMKIVAAGTNPVQLTRGMDKTVAGLVKELKKLSTEVADDKDLANVASVSGESW